MKKKQLAFVLHNLDSGGAQRVVSTLANEFSKTFDVCIITLVDCKPFYYLEDNVSHIKCTSESLVSENIFQALNNNLFLYKRLKSILEEKNIDITIGFTTTANVLCVAASRALNIPCIISERSNPNIYVPNKLWRFLRKYFYKKADYLVVQTDLIRNYFKEFILQDRLVILPNPLSRELSKNKKTRVLRNNLILSVGRLDKNKAQDLLIKAFANVDNQNWGLVFVGDGQEKENYINLVKKLDLESKVTFAGKSSKIYDYYNSSKIFAFTSQSEGFPNVLIEAMYFALPCISTNCPTGPSEIINEGKNGFLIPVNDQKALESKLSLLMRSESLRKDLGENGLLSISKYETDNVISQWNDIITNSINK